MMRTLGRFKKLGIFTIPWICGFVAMGLQTGQGIDLNGYLQTDNRAALENNHDFTWQEYRLALNATSDLTDRAKFYSEIWLRSLGFTHVSSLSDLSGMDKTAAADILLREAYFDLYGFPMKNMDLRIGRQRVQWGTADKLNPTDNINSHDYEDIWDFGRHLGSDGIRLSYYPKYLSASAVFIPSFTPAVLPKGRWIDVLMPQTVTLHGLTVRSMTDTIIMPEYNFRQGSICGLKLAKTFFHYDLSVSYLYGRDDLPMCKKVSVQPVGQPYEVDVLAELFYPRMQVLGFDMAGTIASSGVWGEAAVFLPEEVIMINDFTALGMGISDSVALEHKPYVKYVLGADHDFPHGIYVNVQCLHGFFYERGSANLEDYMMLRMEWKQFGDRLKLSPVNGGLEIKSFDNFKDNYAYLYAPEIAYDPVDNAEINLGCRWIAGSDSTTFGRAKENGEAYLRIKYSF
jgi:hypothetical protein